MSGRLQRQLLVSFVAVVFSVFPTAATGQRSGGHASAGGGHVGGGSRGFSAPARGGGNIGTWHGTARRGTYRGNYFGRYRPYGFTGIVPILPFVDDSGFYDNYDNSAAAPQDDYEYDQGPDTPYAYGGPPPSYGPQPYGPYAAPPQPYGPYAVPQQGDTNQASQNQSAPPQPPVTVVLRNGQQFKAQSYAVTNDTFWDFSGATPRKVPLSSIDVPASEKATTDSGAEFPQFPDVSGR